MVFMFWFLMLFVIYTYLGYPVVLWLKSRFTCPRKKSKASRCEFPFVSVVIAVRNEAEHIRDRIRNIRQQTYPTERIELVIVSDGSTDQTNEIVSDLKCSESMDNFLTLACHFPSRGKAFCINKAIAVARGEIIVFADARQRFSTNTIGVLSENFFDPLIGCVSGQLILEETPGSSIQGEMGAYWKFEKWIRKLESLTGSVPGATGAIYAIRKELFRPIPNETLLDDVLIPLGVCMQGFRTVFDENAIAYDSFSMNLDLEKRRKVRTLAGNWQLLFLKQQLLNPRRNPVLLRFLSHKIFRLLVPYCLIVLFALSCQLKTISAIVFLSIIFFGCVAWLLPSFEGRLGLLSKAGNIFRSIMMLNFFAALAPFKLILGSKKLW